MLSIPSLSSNVLYCFLARHVSVGAQVVASSLDTLEPVLLEGFDSKEDLVACLKASANVPRIAGDPIQLRYTTPPPHPPQPMTFLPVIGPPF